MAKSTGKPLMTLTEATLEIIAENPALDWDEVYTRAAARVTPKAPRSASSYAAQAVMAFALTLPAAMWAQAAMTEVAGKPSVVENCMRMNSDECHTAVVANYGSSYSPQDRQDMRFKVKTSLAKLKKMHR
jgi:hypothetical protein